MSWLVRMDIDVDAVIDIGVIDCYGWHKRLWDCFPGAPEQKRDFLTRIDPLEGAFRLWVLSPSKPVRPAWCPEDDFQLKEVSASFLSHRYYAFDLRANPTKAKVQRGSNGETLRRTDGKRLHGKRIPFVEETDLRAWLDRQGVNNGFLISDAKPLEIGPIQKTYFTRQGRTGCHYAVQFRGILEATDHVKLAAAYQGGLGDARGFGFGLLLLAPVNL